MENERRGKGNRERRMGGKEAGREEGGKSM